MCAPRQAVGLAMNNVGRVYPWREGNRFTLLVDGPCYFPDIFERIDQAREQVDVELYLIEDGACAERLVDTLAAAAARGVRVRCLFDGFGSMGLGEEPRDRLCQAGVALRTYNPLSWRLRFRNLHRDHRKIVLIDRQLSYVGGAGVTDEFWSPDQADAVCWHEAMVRIEGPLVADWQELFDTVWDSCLKRRIWQFPLPKRQPVIPQTPLGREGMGRVAYAAARQHRDVMRSLILSVATARKRVWLATPYFLPNRRLRRALVRSARRGVDVRLVLTGQHTDHPPVRYAGHQFYRQLLRASVRIHEFQPHFSHLKLVLVDDWVSIGSCNFDHWNLRWNLEANLEAVDPSLVDQVVDCFHTDFAHSEEVDLNAWRSRSLLARLNQWLWGRLDQLVMGFFNRNG